MRKLSCVAGLLLASVLAVPLMTTGCGEHRYYDPYYHDYHRWGPEEDAYYVHWERETHREHRDFAHRSHEEQKEYWSWRHSQK